MKLIRHNLIAAAVLAVLPFAAQAQGLQIAKVSKFGSDAKPAQAVFTDAKLFQTALDRGYNNQRTALEKKIRDYLGKGDRFAKGITLYNMNLRLGQANFRFLANDRFEITINGNYMYAKSTTPSVFGSYADPAAQFDFDVRVTGRLVLPTRTQPNLRIEGLALYLPKARVKGRNLTGNIGVFVLGLFKNQVKTLLKNEIDKQMKGPVTSQLTALLAQPNRVIAPLFQQNYLDVSARIDNPRQLLIITMTHTTSLLPPGPPVLKYDPTLPVVR